MVANQIAIYRDDWKEQFQTRPTNSFDRINNHWTGNNLTTLLEAGGAKYFDIDPNSLIGLASSSLSMNDQLDALHKSIGESEIAELSASLNALPDEVHQARKNQLDPKTVALLENSAGHIFPQDKKGGWWGPFGMIQDVANWGGPWNFLNPNNPLAKATSLTLGLPFKTLGWTIGRVVKAIEPTYNFGTRIFRSLNYAGDGDVLNGIWKPGDWLEGWNESNGDNNSYKKNAIKETKELVGEEDTELLRLFLGGGLPFVYEHFKDEGMDQMQATKAMETFYSRLASDKMSQGLEILEDGRNSFFHANVDFFNEVINPFTDVGYQSTAGKWFGGITAFMTGVIMDPITYMLSPTKLAQVRTLRGSVKGYQDMNLLHDAVMVKKYLGLDKNPQGFKENVKHFMPGSGYRRGKAMRETIEAPVNIDDAALQRWASEHRFKEGSNLGINIALDKMTDNLIRMENEVTEVFRIEELISAGKAKRSESLLADFMLRNPQISSGMSWMLQWQDEALAKRISIIGDEAIESSAYSSSNWVKGVTELSDESHGAAHVLTKGTEVWHSPTLSTSEGYWSFLIESEQGMLWRAANSHKPSGLNIPSLGPIQQKWKYARENIDKTMRLESPLEQQFVMNKAAAEWLGKSEELLSIQLLNVLDTNLKTKLSITDVTKIVESHMSAGMEDAATVAARFGIEGEDYVKMENLLDDLIEDLPGALEADPQLIHYIDWLDENAIYTRNKLGKIERKFKVPPEEWDGSWEQMAFGKNVDDTGHSKASLNNAAYVAARNYMFSQTHRLSSHNAEVTALSNLKVLGEAAAVLLGTYPWKLVSSLVKKVPKKKYLDFVDSREALPQFQALVEMGAMSNTPRRVIEDMLHRFAVGGEAERMLVVREFYLDFLGRSGALQNPDRGLQKFLGNFVTRLTHEYSQTGSSTIGLSKIDQRAALIPGSDNMGDLARANMIPDWHELAALSQNMNFYRSFSWGMHLPQMIYKFNKVWRPAVLLRLGIPIRNGGEELFTTLLREGPKNYITYHMAKRRAGFSTAIDEYGMARKVLKGFDTEAEHSALWRPIQFMYRQMETMLGVSEKSITVKAAKEVFKDNASIWYRLNAQERKQALLIQRSITEHEVLQTQRSKITNGVKGVAESFSESVGRWTSGVRSDATAGMRQVAESLAQRVDPTLYRRFSQRGMPTPDKILRWGEQSIISQDDMIYAMEIALTHPTFSDSAAHGIMGAFDPYMNNGDMSLDSILMGKEGSAVQGRFKVGLNYEGTELAWLSNHEGSAGVNTLDLSMAISQRLERLRGSPAVVAAAKYVRHYIDPELHKFLKPYSDFFRKTIDDVDELNIHMGRPEGKPIIDIDSGQIIEDGTPAIEGLNDAGSVIAFLRKQIKASDSALQEQFQLQNRFNRLHSTYRSPASSSKAPTDLKELNWVEEVNNLFPKGKRYEDVRVKNELVPSELQYLIKEGESSVSLYSVLQDLFNPVNGQDPNIISFLLGAMDESINPNLFSFNADAIMDEALDIMFATGMRPDNQMDYYKMIRSAPNYKGVPISHPLPPQHQARVWFPMISGSNAQRLAQLMGGRKVAAKTAREAGGIGSTTDILVFQDRFRKELTKQLSSLGEDLNIVDEVLQLIHPGNYQKGFSAGHLDFWSRTRGGYSQSNLIPLMSGSHDPRIAKAIGESIQKALNIKFKGGARIGSKNILVDEFYNRSAYTKPEKHVVEVTRAGIRSNSDSSVMHGLPLSDRPMFYGAGPKEGSGPVTDTIWGARESATGLGEKKVFGMSPEYLYGADFNEISLARKMAKGEQFQTVFIYKNKNTGQTIILNEADEARLLHIKNRKWISETDSGPIGFANPFNKEDWVEVDRQWVHMDHISTKVDEINIGALEELIGTITDASRSPQNMKIFRPWLDEVLEENPVDLGRVNAYAGSGGWWDHAPENILGFKPIQTEPSFRKAGMNLINSGMRSWFDGVSNPIINAMSREPMFITNFAKALSETADIRKLFYHSTGYFDNLAQGLTVNKGKKVYRISGEGQFEIPELENLLTLDRSREVHDTKHVALFKALDLDHTDPFRISRIKEGFLQALDDSVLGKRIKNLSDEQVELLGRYANVRFTQFNKHVNVSMQRTYSLTGQFIDDHTLRSQFQEIVSGLIPFWFAEDQFLRRMARSLQHNPKMFRDLHLLMMAGVHTGVIKEDQNGEKRLMVPGSGIGTGLYMEMADRFPIIDNVFGGSFGVLADSGMSMSIHVIPGYDLDTSGQPGFGPFLAVPIAMVAERNPEIRARFEHNLIGGRYGGDVATSNILSQFLPFSPLVQKGLAPFNADQWLNPGSRSKATMDIIAFMDANDLLPSQEEIANSEDPDVFVEDFLTRVDGTAAQFQFLQGLFWFAGPATPKLNDLVVKNEEWEWNKEFYDLIQTGVPFEKAFELFVTRRMKEDGEYDPYTDSPMTPGRTTKVPFSVLESTEEGNVWLGQNKDFVSNYRYTSTFFMPRDFSLEDNEYSSEARERQIALGLRKQKAPKEFLEEIYYGKSFARYTQKRQTYQNTKFKRQKQGLDNTVLDKEWDIWYEGFKRSNPVFTTHIETRNSAQRRRETLSEMRDIIANSSMVPASEYKAEILVAMSTIVGLQDKLERISWVEGNQRERDALKIEYYKAMTKFAMNKPWLNELYWSVFLPMIGDTWLAKYNAGLIDVRPL